MTKASPAGILHPPRGEGAGGVDLNSSPAHPHSRSELRIALAAHPIRTGVHFYSGSEVGRPECWTTIPVYRPPEELFSAATLASFARVPITMAHPSGGKGLTRTNAKRFHAGYVDGPGVSDGEFVRVTLIITNLRAIKGIAAGQVELSCGYGAYFDWEPGVTPDGAFYRAIQLGLRVNHVAIGIGARDPKCRILQPVRLSS